MSSESPTKKDSDPKIYIYECSREYFDAQVRFAAKFSELTGESFQDCLLKYTALYRRLTNAKPKDELSNEWKNLTNQVDPANLDQATDLVYTEYLKNPHSIYVPQEFKDDGKHFGPFGYDYYPDTDTVKMHFTNTIRGPRSALAKEFQADRNVELTMMFASISRVHPEAKDVLGGSWLYNMEGYRRLFPESFVTNMRRLVPPEMSYQGNSLWGQFLSSTGGVKEETYSKFLENLAKTKTEKDLIDTFPYPVLQPKADIKDFYAKYGIGTS